MKAYTIGSQEGLGSLTLVDRPDPVPGPGEALIAVRALCLNHRDMLVLAGSYGARRDPARVPCSDGMGVIEALGAGVTGFAAGDRVSAGHFATWIDGDFTPSAFARDLGVSHDGWLAEKIVIPAAALTKIPDALSDTQAAALPAAGLTAWHAVVEVGAVKPGQLVLALGTGGVSIAALQIAKMAGARVAITSSSDEKLATARKLGADITVNYRDTPDWAAAVTAANGGAGADIVVETGGQATLADSITAAGVNARIVIIGALAGPAQQGLPNFGTIIGKNLTIRGIANGSQAMFRRYVRAAAAGGLDPVIDRRFAFADAPAAFEHLHSGAHFGKVMIEVA